MMCGNSLTCDGAEVTLGNPSVPVVLQCVVCRVSVLVRTERVFIDNAVVSSILEE